MFDRDRITSESFIRYVEHHTRLESTNTLAAELHDDLHVRSPALVLSDEQTAGRGRGRNTWWSSAGALTFTVVLDSRDWGPTPDSQQLVSLAAGLAVRNALAADLSGHAVQIKWPNDVLAADRKICGILCEHHTTTRGGVFLIGIGINVNNSLSMAPDDVRLLGTSLFDLTGRSQDLTDVLISVLNELESVCCRLREDAVEIVREVAVFDRLQGCRITVDTQTHVITGLCEGIADDGALLLRTESGVVSIHAGTVLTYV